METASRLLWKGRVCHGQAAGKAYNTSVLEQRQSLKRIT